MQFAKEESSLSNQDPKRFREDEREIANVFKHQIAYDQIIRLTFAGPRPSNVSHFETYVIQSQFIFGLPNHARGKVDSADPFANLSQQCSILARAAAKF